MKRICVLLLPALLAAQDMARPRITGVAHIAIYAADFEKSRAFYRDFLGLKSRIRSRNPMELPR
jgi:catechol-2,3-dioxygenase